MLRDLCVPRGTHKLRSPCRLFHVQLHARPCRQDHSLNAKRTGPESGCLKHEPRQQNGVTRWRSSKPDNRITLNSRLIHTATQSMCRMPNLKPRPVLCRRRLLTLARLDLTPGGERTSPHARPLGTSVLATWNMPPPPSAADLSEDRRQPRSNRQDDEQVPEVSNSVAKKVIRSIRRERNNRQKSDEAAHDCAEPDHAAAELQCPGKHIGEWQDNHGDHSGPRAIPLPRRRPRRSPRLPGSTRNRPRRWPVHAPMCYDGCENGNDRPHTGKGDRISCPSDDNPQGNSRPVVMNEAPPT